MKLWEQYRSCYQKDNSHYEYYTDDEDLIVLDAGKDGVTEAHIQALKELHKNEVVDEQRHARHQHNGEKTVNLKLNYDGLAEDERAYMDFFVDSHADPEWIVIQGEEKKDKRRRILKALKGLKRQPRRILLLVTMKGIKAADIARRKGVSRQTISASLALAREKFCKLFVNNP